VSTTSQGPGWWLASDGRWYPPEQQPGTTQVLAPPIARYSPVSQPPTTSGLALASLVLSVVWLAGVGSVLAIVFGFMARSEIRRSNGAKSGGAMAVAGIVIGFVGVAGLAPVIVGIGVLGTAATNLALNLRPTVVTYGTTVNVASSLNPGLKTMTVYPLGFPTSSTGAPSGDSIAVSRMRICADGSGSQSGFNGVLMNAYFADESTAGLDPVATVQGMGQNLAAVTGGIPANGCLSGYVAFDVRTGTHPIGVEYDSNVFRTIQWTG
jgi:hypothetical protein